MQNDRFSTLMCERNNYKQMHQNVLESALRVRKQSAQEREDLERNWSESMKTNFEAITILQDLLAFIGVIL
jgi:hypothetical protein